MEESNADLVRRNIREAAAYEAHLAARLADERDPEVRTRLKGEIAAMRYVERAFLELVDDDPGKEADEA